MLVAGCAERQVEIGRLDKCVVREIPRSCIILKFIKGAETVGETVKVGKSQSMWKIVIIDLPG